ncbi:MAG: class I SAM-dependent methyltransferase [Gammaproteobacteria bacterium]|nr:class I SAM-dependent methyltransferase [Gammaproteobacteria bacterium]
MAKDKKHKKNKHKEKAKDKSGPTMAETADRHLMYQAAVQAADVEVEFLDKIFREIRGRQPLSFKEDFCGTALLSVEWCKSDPKRTAIGVDIDEPTLKWGGEHNLQPAGSDVASRVTLLQKDVREVLEPKVDITCAFNFSFCIFKTRGSLREYFTKARAGLKDDGMLVLDIFGGTECMDTLEEETELEDVSGTYVWEHAKFNPITNEILCHIHFEFPDKSRMEKAFTYDWRLWSVPELKELLEEAGYSKVRVYWEQFEETDDDDDYLESNGEFLEATEVENQESWHAYIVAEK